MFIMLRYNGWLWSIKQCKHSLISNSVQNMRQEIQCTTAHLLSSIVCNKQEVELTNLPCSTCLPLLMSQKHLFAKFNISKYWRLQHWFLRCNTETKMVRQKSRSCSTAGMHNTYNIRKCCVAGNARHRGSKGWLLTVNLYTSEAECPPSRHLQFLLIHGHRQWPQLRQLTLCCFSGSIYRLIVNFQTAARLFIDFFCFGHYYSCAQALIFLI